MVGHRDGSFKRKTIFNPWAGITLLGSFLYCPINILEFKLKNILTFRMFTNPDHLCEIHKQGNFRQLHL